MSMTRDQLRAARMLLHLQQDVPDELSGVGVATIRRFETGSDIRGNNLAKLREAPEEAGIVLLDGETPPSRPIGLGVALDRDLPKVTHARILADEEHEAARIQEGRRRLEAAKGQRGRRRPGRPP